MEPSKASCHQKGKREAKRSSTLQKQGKSRIPVPTLPAAVRSIDESQKASTKPSTKSSQPPTIPDYPVETLRKVASSPCHTSSDHPSSHSGSAHPQTSNETRNDIEQSGYHQYEAKHSSRLTLSPAVTMIASQNHQLNESASNRYGNFTRFQNSVRSGNSTT